jgi:hypothetical protein
MLFSIELGDPDVRCALEARKAAAGNGAADDLEFVKREIAASLGDTVLSSIRLTVDKKKGKLLMELPVLSGRGARPQDIVAAVFGLDTAAFYLTREKFVYAVSARS